jgi:hypothetical protein
MTKWIVAGIILAVLIPIAYFEFKAIWSVRPPKKEEPRKPVSELDEILHNDPDWFTARKKRTKDDFK